MSDFDVIVVGGGPAGSTAARTLTSAGLSVGVLDREAFPRVKLCAGWLSLPIWQELGLSARSYPHSLWRWDRCHVHHRGRRTTVAARGYFVRRYEFDDYLLSRSGAHVVRHQVKDVRRDGQLWVIDGKYRARVVIGAGGTHCPVARVLAPRRQERPVGAQELELHGDPRAIAAHRAGEDGEPELHLHDDLGGYSWNVPKTDWLNVGSGTMNARRVRDAWHDAREHFQASGHLPPGTAQELEEHAKGHSYYLFDPAHLSGCQRDGAFLVGDSLGLAQPLTAEGILPAVISGRACAEAILAGDAASYERRLASHPVLVDYDLYYRARMAGFRVKQRLGGRKTVQLPAAVARLASLAVARGFAWMFAAHPLPRAVHRLAALGGVP